MATVARQEGDRLREGSGCPVGIKNMSRISAIQWLLGILITCALAGAFYSTAALGVMSTETASLNRRITLAEDRWERSQQDMGEIKQLLRDLNRKIEDLR